MPLENARSAEIRAAWRIITIHRHAFVIPKGTPKRRVNLAFPRRVVLGTRIIFIIEYRLINFRPCGQVSHVPGCCLLSTTTFRPQFL